MPLPRARLSWAVPAALLVTMAGLLVASSLHKKLAYDEFDNLAYGHRFLIEGPSAEMNGQRMPVLALNAAPCLGDGCRLKILNLSEGKRLLVRLPTMAFCLATGALLYLWAGEMLGARAALLTLVLFVFQPTFLGHGKQVTSDTQSAFFLAAAAYCVWKAVRSGSNGWAVATGLALAGGLASKFTNMLAVPIVVVLAFTIAAPAVPLRRRATIVVIACLTALVGINAAYLFDGTFQPGASYVWRSAGFPHLVPSWLPIPLPRAFVLGLDYSHLLQEDQYLGRGNNYVLGELNRDGRWYAFPLMILLKTPLATFVLFALALRRLPRSVAWILLLPAGVVIAVFSFFVDPQLGIRYVLPAFPFLILVAGAATPESPRWPRLQWSLAIWAVVSSLSYYPHFISYFNELIGRRLNAYRYLADSNLDWENHNWWIERYQRAHPELHLVVNPEGPTAGDIVVSTNQLVGVLRVDKYRWLRENFEPVGHVAYGHLLYRITPEELASLHLPPSTPVPPDPEE